MEMKKSHKDYNEFDSKQFIVELDIGEKIEILVNGKKEIEYMAQYINCHSNIIFQDKGERKNPIIKIPSLRQEIEELKKIIKG